MTKVAVIVPCYNQAPYIREALQAVRSQSFTDWVCVIVNDASTDESDPVIRSFLEEAKDERFRYFSLPQNRGVSHARNYAISHSDSDYILPLDGDDIISDRYLEKTVPILNSNWALKLVYTDACDFGIKKSESLLPDFTLATMCYANPFHATCLFRRQAFYETNGYRENMKFGYEDWDLWLQFVKNKNDVYRVRETLFYARQKAQSRNAELMGNQEKERAMRLQLKINNESFFEKHGHVSAGKPANIFRKMLRRFISKIG